MRTYSKWKLYVGLVFQTNLKKKDVAEEILQMFKQTKTNNIKFKVIEMVFEILYFYRSAPAPMRCISAPEVATIGCADLPESNGSIFSNFRTRNSDFCCRRRKSWKPRTVFLTESEPARLPWLPPSTSSTEQNITIIVVTRSSSTPKEGFSGLP